MTHQTTKTHFVNLIWTSLLFLTFCHSTLLEAKSHSKKVKYQLSIAAIFRNEAHYLKEWIEYYRLLGVEHFYLYNNLSSDNYQEQLTPYIKNGIVELTEWTQHAYNWQEWDHTQVAAYRHALGKAKHHTRWLAIIDIDEFIVPVSTDNLITLLKRYENRTLGGVCAMWYFFGTSHVEKIPSNKLLIETLVLHSGPANNGEINNVWKHGAYKSIVRPEYVSEISSPHYCHYVKGREHVMLENDLIRINHYWTRDNDFLMNEKIPRRQAWGQDSQSVISWAAGMNGNRDNNPILRFVPALRKKILNN